VESIRSSDKKMLCANLKNLQKLVTGHGALIEALLYARNLLAVDGTSRRRLVNMDHVYACSETSLLEVAIEKVRSALESAVPVDEAEKLCKAMGGDQSSPETLGERDECYLPDTYSDLLFCDTMTCTLGTLPLVNMWLLKHRSSALDAQETLAVSGAVRDSIRAVHRVLLLSHATVLMASVQSVSMAHWVRECRGLAAMYARPATMYAGHVQLAQQLVAGCDRLSVERGLSELGCAPQQLVDTVFAVMRTLVHRLPAFLVPRVDVNVCLPANRSVELTSALAGVSGAREYCFLAMCETSDVDAVRALYATVPRGSAFGRLVGVEQSAEVSAVYAAYEGYHCASDGLAKYTFTQLAQWLRLTRGVTAASPMSMSPRQLDVSLERGVVDTVETLDDGSLGVRPSFHTRRRFVTPLLVLECVRQLVSSAAQLECASLSEAANSVACMIELNDVFVDRHGRVLLVAGNTANKSRSGAAKQGGAVGHVLRIAARALLAGMYGGECVLDERQFDARRVPQWTRFHTLTPLAAIDFVRSVLDSTSSACALNAHPLFTCPVASSVDTLVPVQRMPRLTAAAHAEAENGATFVGKQALPVDTSSLQLDDEEGSCLARYNVSEGRAAEQFARLVRSFAACSRLTGETSDVGAVRLDVVTPGPWPSCVKLETGEPLYECSSRDHFSQRHDDYLVDSRRGCLSRVADDYASFRTAGSSHLVVECHTCMGARRVSRVLRHLHDDTDAARGDRTASEDANSLRPTSRELLAVHVALIAEQLHSLVTSFDSFNRLLIDDSNLVQNVKNARSLMEGRLVTLFQCTREVAAEVVGQLVNYVPITYWLLRRVLSRIAEVEAVLMLREQFGDEDDEEDADFVLENSASSSSSSGSGSSNSERVVSNEHVARHLSSNIIPVCLAQCTSAEDKRAHTDAVFRICSLFRSSQVNRVLTTGTFANRPLELFDSTQAGRGNGVSLSIWNDFFCSLFEDHALFELDGDTEYYKLAPFEVAYDDADTYATLADDACMAAATSVCRACTAYARTVGSLGAGLTVPCQLASRTFMRTLGKVIRYCMINEIYMAYKLHPLLAYMLSEPDVSSTMTRCSTTRCAAECVDTSRLQRQAAVDGMLNVNALELEALSTSFKSESMPHQMNIRQRDVELTANTRYGYLHAYSNVACVLSLSQIRAWTTCVSSFDWLPLTVLVRAACGYGTSTAVAAFGELLSGASSERLTGADLWMTSTFQIVASRSTSLVPTSTSEAMHQDLPGYYAVMSILHSSFVSIGVVTDHALKYAIKSAAIGRKVFERAHGARVTRDESTQHVQLVDVLRPSSMVCVRKPSGAASAKGSFVECVRRFVASTYELAVEVLDAERVHTPTCPVGGELYTNVCRDRSISAAMVNESELVRALQQIELLCSSPCAFLALMYAAIRKFERTRPGQSHAELYTAGEQKRREVNALPGLDSECNSVEEVRVAETATIGGRVAAMRELFPLMSQLHERLHTAYEYAGQLSNMALYNTYAYWRRWILHDERTTDDKRVKLLYTATGSRSLPPVALRCAKQTLATTPHASDMSLGSVYMAVAEGTRRLYGDELKLDEQWRVIDAANLAASFGSLVASIYRPAVSVPRLRQLIGQSGVRRAPNVEDFSVAEPRERTALTVHALRSKVYENTASNVKLFYDEATFDKQAYASTLSWLCSDVVSREHRLTVDRLSQSRWLRTLTSRVLNRLPEYTTCGRHMCLFVYESYEKFREVLEMSLVNADRSFEML